MTNEQLITCAYKAKNQAYAPYSKFRVGAAALGEDGQVYCGCNIENSSFPAGICAERVAVSKGISEGCKKILKIAIVSENENFTFPCGICRQFLYEIMPDGIVILHDKKKGILERHVSELLPDAFLL